MATETEPSTLGIAGSAGPARRTTYAVGWSGEDLGLCDDVDPTGVKFNFEPITTGSTGKKNKLGDRYVGSEGSVKVQLRQPNAQLYAILNPWSANGSSGIITAPPLNSDLYAYSKPLVLHPVDMGTATTEDITFANACPVPTPGPKRTGGADDVHDVEFMVYPPRGPLATTPLAISPATIGP